MRKVTVLGVVILLLLSGCASTTPNDQFNDNTSENDESNSTDSATLNINTERLDSALITRRSLSSDYVQIGEISRADSDRTTEMENESIKQWYRRTFRSTSDSNGPLLITTGIKHYDSSNRAQQAIETATAESSEVERDVQQVTIRNDLRIYQISSQPDTGSYVTTAIHREGAVVFRAQTIDPNREYDDQAQRLLSEMIFSVTNQTE